MSGQEAFQVGLRVGKYELVRKLAEGGFGVLWVAKDTALDRDLAIKFLHPHHSSNPDVVRRFLLEAQSLGKLVHPGIVTVFESGQVTGTGTPADGAAFIIMELLVGETLSQRLARIGRFTPSVGMEICRQVANALQSAHEQGIVHRDLKSDNIMLVPDLSLSIGERAKVLDFGIAKQATTATATANNHTQAGMVFGTPNYMSPEQCRSAADANAASDIYSLGCILFELICGKPPFSGAMAELIAHHLLTPPPVPSIVQPGIPPHLDQVIAAMLAKRPEDRPATMTVVERILEENRLGGMPARRRTLGGARVITTPPPAGGQPVSPAALAAAVGAQSPHRNTPPPIVAMTPMMHAPAAPMVAAPAVPPITAPSSNAAAKTIAAQALGAPLPLPASAAPTIATQAAAAPTIATQAAAAPASFDANGAGAVPVSPPVKVSTPTTLNSASGVAAEIDARTNKKKSSKFLLLAGVVIIGAGIAVVAVVSGGGSGGDSSSPTPAAPPSTPEPPTKPPTTNPTTTTPVVTKPVEPVTTKPTEPVATGSGSATKPTEPVATGSGSATKPTEPVATGSGSATKPTEPVVTKPVEPVITKPTTTTPVVTTTKPTTTTPVVTTTKPTTTTPVVTTTKPTTTTTTTTKPTTTTTTTTTKPTAKPDPGQGSAAKTCQGKSCILNGNF